MLLQKRFHFYFKKQFIYLFIFFYILKTFCSTLNSTIGQLENLFFDVTNPFFEGQAFNFNLRRKIDVTYLNEFSII